MGNTQADRRVHGESGKRVKVPRLASAIGVVLLLSAALAAAATYTRTITARCVHAVAGQMFAHKNQGAALQRAAFQQPDLLPIYGSSDLNVRNRYHASALFRSYPTGFAVFPVGNLGSSNLIWLQALAAVGSDLRGKRVVVSLSARSFTDEMADRHAYAANFSRLHASALAFSTDLSFAVKRGAARRMLAYPQTLARDPLLRFALERLADGSLTSRIAYYVSLPLGKLQNVVLRLQDDWETFVFLRAQSGLSGEARHSAVLDWTDLLHRAEQETRLQANNNQLGFENALWTRLAPEIAGQKGLSKVEPVQTNLERSEEWTDLELLLRAVRGLGGEPLILSIPMKGAYYDYLGIPFSTRRIYYERLRRLAKTHGILAVDFADHDSDTYFTIDAGLHLSDSGWIHYDRALDAFFHGRSPDDA